MSIDHSIFGFFPEITPGLPPGRSKFLSSPSTDCGILQRRGKTGPAAVPFFFWPN